MITNMTNKKDLLFTGFISCLFIFVSSAIMSCAEDEGNYDYTELNELSIAGIESMYNVEQFTNLNIDPQITGSEGFNADDYEYLWYIFKAYDREIEADTLSHDIILSVPVNNSPNMYTLVFKVINKKTGLFKMQQCNVNVVNTLSAGLAILSSVDGHGDLAFINTLDKVSENVYETVNGKSLGQDPFNIVLTGNNSCQQMLLVSTSTESIFIDPTDFRQIMPLSEMFNFPPATGKVATVCRNRWNNNELLIVDGALFQRTLYGDGGKFPKYTTKKSGDYDLAPFNFFGDGVGYYYDQKYQRFTYMNYNRIITVVAEVGNPYFDPANVGMKMLWGKNFPVSDVSYMRAVMQDDKGKRYLLGALKNYHTDNVTKENLYCMTPTHMKELTTEGAYEAKCFAISMNEPNFLYYASGNKIICVSYNTGNVISTYTLPENIDYMEFNYSNSYNTLYVGVSDGSGKSKSGSVYSLIMSSDGSLLESKTYKNICGKVVDFEIK